MSSPVEKVDVDFWAQRWEEGRIGFHEGTPNGLLVTHVARIETKKPARILVPLAGKTVDMKWLADRGHEVVGVEAVPRAVEAFVAEHGSPRGLTLVCADFFDLSPATLGTFDAIYDRAALVALEPETRSKYVDACRAFVREGGVTLLLGIEYVEPRSPPPWEIDEKTVRELHRDRDVEVLGSRLWGPFRETAYLIAGKAQK